MCDSRKSVASNTEIDFEKKLRVEIANCFQLISQLIFSGKTPLREVNISVAILHRCLTQLLMGPRWFSGITETLKNFEKKWRPVIEKPLLEKQEIDDPSLGKDLKEVKVLRTTMGIIDEIAKRCPPTE